MKIGAMSFITDERWKYLGKLVTNSFRVNNPNIPFTLVDFSLPKRYTDWESYHLYHNDKESSCYKGHKDWASVGILKYFVQLEFMKKYNLDALIFIGADVLTVGSFEWIIGDDLIAPGGKSVKGSRLKYLKEQFSILISPDIGGFVYNPDVHIILNRDFLTQATTMADAMYKNPKLCGDMDVASYGDMAIGNQLVTGQQPLFKSQRLGETFSSDDCCFNANTFRFNSVLPIYNYDKNEKLSVLDIGTGSGCIIISILKDRPNFKGTAIDVCRKALNVAKYNAKIHQLENRIKFYKSSVDNFFKGKYDLIISNPPYINKFYLKYLEKDVIGFEPNLALEGGIDGFSVLERVIKKSSRLLKIGGKLVLEIGFDQKLKVSKLLKKEKYFVNKIIKDYGNRDRCIICTKL